MGRWLFLHRSPAALKSAMTITFCKVDVVQYLLPYNLKALKKKPIDLKVLSQTYTLNRNHEKSKGDGRSFLPYQSTIPLIDKHPALLSTLFTPAPRFSQSILVLSPAHTPSGPTFPNPVTKHERGAALWTTIEWPSSHESVDVSV